MIRYERGGINFFLKLLQRKGSVFPKALCIALPAGLVCGLLRWLINAALIPDSLAWLEDPNAIMKESQAWSGFSFLVGFLVVFRTSQAYNRFWEGCTATSRMRAEWFECCSALVSFCRFSSVAEGTVFEFRHNLVRLFSMLHALALAEIEDDDKANIEDKSAFTFELIDVEGIDADSLMKIQNSDSKVQLVYQWIQCLLVESIKTQVLNIPPPILSRSFQEMANGMVQFHEALKVSQIPFPFAYAQTCDCLLMLHWLIAPFVVTTWTTQAPWAAVLCFVQVFILWCLDYIAIEIENPFGEDANDLDTRTSQLEFNTHLRLLVDPDTQKLPHSSQTLGANRHSFTEVWESLRSDTSVSRTAQLMGSRTPSRSPCRTPEEARTEELSRSPEKPSDMSRWRSQVTENDIEVSPRSSSLEVLAPQKLEKSDINRSVCWRNERIQMCSMSNDTGLSQMSLLPMHTFKNQTHGRSMMPTTSTSSANSCSIPPTRARESNLAQGLQVSTHGLELPELPLSEDMPSGPPMPASKAWSLLPMHRWETSAACGG